jgi:hypothetical protein
MQMMTRRRFNSRLLFPLFLCAAVAACPWTRAEEPTPTAIAGFNSYVSSVETRLDRQHQLQPGFLASDTDPQTLARLHRGELIIDKLTPANINLPGAMLHHWRGTVFAPGATAADFDRLMRDFSGYPQLYAPQVVSARVLAHDGDRYQVLLRVRQKHIITVAMDIAYDVIFARVDAHRGFSRSRSTHIAEVESAGTAHERALSPAEQRGFLWRLNTYWTYEERDGGLYMQIESISLTRAIPTGLAWAVGPFVESVPRESLEFTLHATANALRKRQ